MLSITANISKPDLVGELHERKVEFRMDEKKDRLVQKLESELAGIHHVPALLFGSTTLNLQQYGLEKYEILPVEPLHTITGHTKNLYAEIPSHLSKQEKEYLKQQLMHHLEGRT